jgi:hypothetical protein
VTHQPTPKMGDRMGDWPYIRTSTVDEFAAVFWERVAKGDGCWTWLGRTTGKGYGQITSKWFTTKSAHRIAYELANGPAGDLHVLHRCDNPPCVNPAHLFLGTNRDNIHDMLRKGRQPRIGSKNPHAKLTEAQVGTVKRMLADGWSYAAISLQTGVPRYAISAIYCGKVWRHVEAA